MGQCALGVTPTGWIDEFNANINAQNEDTKDDDTDDIPLEWSEPFLNKFTNALTTTTPTSKKRTPKTNEPNTRETTDEFGEAAADLEAAG